MVGRRGGSHIGASLGRAVQAMGLKVELCDIDVAWRYGGIAHKVFWHFLGKRPVALSRFGQLVVEQCRAFQPQVMVTTGMAPLTQSALAECRRLGVRCVNFSTDDPFNPTMQATWFLRALPSYDTIFSPRTSNLEELRALGCNDVRYLMFGYDPDLFFSEPQIDGEASDLFFAGNAEADRARYIAAAVQSGLNVRLHGLYWERYPGCRGVSRGFAHVDELRRAIASSRISLCLVRHDNRDGHSMRTFEIPAVGACIVVEDTPEHREIFGDEGMRVVYFSDPAEMVAKTKSLLRDSPGRARLREAAHSWITNGPNTYADRLKAMLDFAS